MRKILSVVLFVTVIFGLVGCGSDKNEQKSSETAAAKVEQKDPSKEIVKKYIEEIKPLVAEIEKIGQDFETLRQKSINGEITDEEFGQEIAKNILPASMKLQTKAAELMPDKEVRGIHEKLIDMVSKNSQGLSEIVSAIDTGDASKITSANELLSEATKTERDFVYDMQDLTEKYNLNLKE